MSRRLSLYVFVVFILNTIICVSPFDINLKGKHGKGYYLDVLIGMPPQKLKVLVDTGSTNFAVAASKNPFIDTYFNATNSTTYKELNKDVFVQYTEGNWSGKLGSDLVQFPSVLVNDIAVRCDVSLITEASNFYVNNSDWQGILGLAYPEISRPDKSVSSYIDAYQEQTNGSSIAFLLKLCGTRTPGNNNHFGAFEILDGSKNLSNFLTAPLLRTWFYEIALKDIHVNGDLLNVSCTDINDDKTIVDSGTSTLKFPEKVYNELITRLYNHTKELDLIITPSFWEPKELSCYSSPQKWDRLPNITLSIIVDSGSYFTLTLPGSSYIRESYDHSEKMMKFCYKVAIEKSTTGTVLGVVALEGFEIFFNRTAKTVGFFKSDCGPNVDVRGPFYTKDTSEHLLESCTRDKNVQATYQNGDSVLSLVLFIIALLLMTGLLLPLSYTYLRHGNINNLRPNVFLNLTRTRLTNED